MELAMQFISNDKTVRNDIIQDLKELNNQSLTTQAKKGEQLVSMMPAIKEAFNLMGDNIVAIKEAFNLMGDNIVELSTENDALKIK